MFAVVWLVWAVLMGLSGMRWFKELPEAKKKEVMQKARSVAYELYSMTIEQLDSDQRERVIAVVRARMGL